MKYRDNEDSPLREIATVCVENMSSDGWKEFTTTSMDEMDKEDFLEAVANTDHKNLITNPDDTQYDMNILTRWIKDWHEDRKITINGNSLTQTVKLGEEMCELCAAIVRGDKDNIVDSLGDMYVVMVAIAELEGFQISECVYHAYTEIKDRKGYLNEQSNFIKEEI